MNNNHKSKKKLLIGLFFLMAFIIALSIYFVLTREDEDLVTEDETYQIAFNVDGGQFLTTISNIHEGDTVTLPIPEKEGYDFDCWMVNGVEVDLEFTFTAETNLIVEAVYQIKTYTISFYDYNGDLLLSEEISHGSDATAPTDPSRIGYTFTGWDKGFNNVISDIDITSLYLINNYTVDFLDRNGVIIHSEEVEYMSDATAPTLEECVGYTFTSWDTVFTSVETNLTVRAQYEENIYYVFFYNIDGEIIATETTTYNGTVDAPDDPIREGYTFTGWSESFEIVKANIFLVATYDTNNYQVVFKDYDGSIIYFEDVVYQDSANSPDIPVREGYTFIGWDLDISEITEDLIVTAEYEINQFTVTFIEHDGTILKTELVDYDTSAIAPELNGKEGYYFTGWSQSYDNVQMDIEVTAYYNVNSYMVNFYDYNNELLTSTWVIYDHDGIAPTTSTVPGYTFTGWDVDFTSVSSHLEVHAVYERNYYTVSFVSNGGESVEDIIVEHGGTITLPTITKTDHYFLGWMYDGVLRSGTYTITEDRVYDANFKDKLEDFTYTVSNGEITITGSSIVSGDIVIPSTYNGMDITTIGDSAFFNFQLIDSVFIPATVTHIGANAFKDMTSLREVILEDGSQLVEIGEFAFSYNISLTSFNLEEATSLETIRTRSFSATDRLTIIIPSSVTLVENHAFFGSEASVFLQSPTVPATWESNWDKHQLWTYEVEIFILYNVKSLNENSDYEYLINNDDTVTILSYQNYGVSNLVIPNTIDTFPVTAIEKKAFMNEPDIVTLTIPNTVVTIGELAFYNMNYLVSVTLENGSALEEIGLMAFGNCSGLTTFNTEDALHLTTIKSEAFYNTDSLTIYIPATVTTMERIVFAYSTATVNIEESSAPITWDVNWDKSDDYNSLATITVNYNVPTP